MVTLMRFNVFVIFILIYGYIFNKLKKSNDKKMIKEFLNLSFFISIIFIISLTILPINQSFDLSFEVNLIPFRTILHFISNFKLIEFSANILGNIILFVPFGFCLFLKEKGNKKATLIICLLFTLSIEITQLAMPSRTTDIDDIILNFLGGYIGMKLATKYKIDNKKEGE